MQADSNPTGDDSSGPAETAIDVVAEAERLLAVDGKGVWPISIARDVLRGLVARVREAETRAEKVERERDAAIRAALAASNSTVGGPPPRWVFREVARIAGIDLATVRRAYDLDPADGE